MSEGSPEFISEEQVASCSGCAHLVTSTESVNGTALAALLFGTRTPDGRPVSVQGEENSCALVRRLREATQTGTPKSEVARMKGEPRPQNCLKGEIIARW